jgi:hypothetical protein
MQHQIEKLLASNIIEKEGEEYIFITTLKIGIAEDKNGDLKVIESFYLKNGKWVGTTTAGELIDIEGNLQVYSMEY